MATASGSASTAMAGSRWVGQVTRLVTGTTVWRAKPPGRASPSQDIWWQSEGAEAQPGHSPQGRRESTTTVVPQGTSPPGHSSTTPTTSWPRVAGQ